MQPTRLILPNGLRLVHCAMPSMHSVAVEIFVGFGSRYEHQSKAGVAHVIEHMLFKGTARRQRPTDISETLDAVGGVLNASTDKEATVYWAKTAREDVSLAVDLLADMLQHSRLVPFDLSREKAVICEELSMLADDPQDWVHVLTDDVLWPRQPIGREIAGTRVSVSSLRRADLLEHLERFYGPNNTVISIAGGISLAEAREQVEDAFADWAPVEAGNPIPAMPGVAPGPRLEPKPIEQLHVCLAYPAISRAHPDRFGLELLSNILGGGASSRLFVQLREKHGLAYDTHAYTTQVSDAGALVAYAAGEPAKGGKLLADLYREIDRLCTHRVRPRELANAKQYFRGRLFLGLEDTQAVAGWFGSQELLEGRLVEPQDVADSVDAVTADDLLRLAQTYLDPAQSRLVAVGPVAGLGLEAQLAGA